jgi:hypothetical protein
VQRRAGEEATTTRAKAEEAKEEWPMLRVAELWREEHVQMKVTSWAAMEEKLREVDAAVTELHTAAAIRSGGSRSSCSSSSIRAEDHSHSVPRIDGKRRLLL